MVYVPPPPVNSDYPEGANDPKGSDDPSNPDEIKIGVLTNKFLPYIMLLMSMPPLPVKKSPVSQVMNRDQTVSDPLEKGKEKVELNKERATDLLKAKAKSAARFLAKAYLDGSISAQQPNDSSLRAQTGGFL